MNIVEKLLVLACYNALFGLTFLVSSSWRLILIEEVSMPLGAEYILMGIATPLYIVGIAAFTADIPRSYMCVRYILIAALVAGGGWILTFFV